MELRPIDWKNVTAEDIQAMMFENETTVWEWKAASWLDASDPKFNNDKFKQTFGETVSSLANTYGGRLIFGIEDGTRNLQECKQKNGNQRMEDWIANKLQAVVDRPLWDFDVYRVPFKDDSSKSIYVAEIRKSLTPHQSVADKKIYHRPAGASVPAPMSYVELMFNQVERAVVDVANFDCSIQIGSPGVLCVSLWFDIINRSQQVASPYGCVLHIEPPPHPKRHRFGSWSAHHPSVNSPDATFVAGTMPHLFPLSSIRVQKDVFLTVLPEGRNYTDFYFFLQDSRIVFRPVSQNHSGESQYINVLAFEDVRYHTYDHERLIENAFNR